MKMDEYLQKKKDLVGKQQEVQDKIKELEDTEKRAQEIRSHLKEEKKKEFQNKVHNFNILGMKFRPWTLNDMVIILFIVAILVVGGVSFMPSEEVSSDVDTFNVDTSNDVSFFTKLFGGFAVKSLDSTYDDSTDEDTTDDSTDEDTSNQESTNPVDFDFEISYQDSPFTTINVTNVDYLWYALNVKNEESFNIKCNINHYVNNELKSDGSVVTIEAGNLRTINMRELSSDTVDNLSKVKLEISCSDGKNSNTKNDKVKHLKFYFS